MQRICLFFGFCLLAYTNSFAQQHVLEHVGVYQGKPLFIQNPFLVEEKEFCITEILINGKPIEINKSSAIIVDFKGQDLFTPVKIKITSSDSMCTPQILNLDAIFFHSTFRFSSVQLSDSVLVWQTAGEREIGEYVVEKLFVPYWTEVTKIPSQGKYEQAIYSFPAVLEEGANKYRIKYEFGNGRYLYSDEVEYYYYLEPVDFNPKVARDIIVFSRSAQFNIFDANGKLVLSGSGNQVDISSLWSGDYVIYFDNVFPGVFTKERR